MQRQLVCRRRELFGPCRARRAVRSHSRPDSSLRAARDGQPAATTSAGTRRRSGAAERDWAQPRQLAGRGRDASACRALVPILVDLAAAFRARPSTPHRFRNRCGPADRGHGRAATWTSRAQRPDAPSALRLRLPDDEEADEHRGYPQRYEPDAFHDALRLSARRLLRPRPENHAACSAIDSTEFLIWTGARPSAEGLDRLSAGGPAGTHVTTNDLCIWPNMQDFGVDVGAVFPIVALGKPAPMPYVWHPRRETERR